jgi:hypothetical protein
MFLRAPQLKDVFSVAVWPFTAAIELTKMLFILTDA